MTIQWTADDVTRPTAPPVPETPQMRVFHQPGHASLSSPPGVVELQPQGRDLECPPELNHHHQFGALAGIGDGMTHKTVWRTYERFLRRQGDRPATIALYRTALGDLWRYLDDHGIAWDRVTPEDVEAWLERPCKPGKHGAGQALSTGTRHTYGRIVARAYRLFAERGWIQGRNPLEDWKPPPDPPRRPRALHVSAIGLLLRRLADDRRLTMMVALGYFQALRVGEIVRLRVTDLALGADPPMVLIQGKGGRDQWMPLSPALVPALRAWLLTRPASGPLIPNYHDPARHLDPKYAAHLLAAAMRPEVGDSGHALRHTAAQQLRRLTRDPFIVKEALRHASLDQQSSYVGSDVDLLAAALAQLPDPLHPPSAAPGA